MDARPHMADISITQAVPSATPLHGLPLNFALVHPPPHLCMASLSMLRWCKRCCSSRLNCASAIASPLITSSPMLTPLPSTIFFSASSASWSCSWNRAACRGGGGDAGFRVQGSRFRIQGSRFRIQCSGPRDQESGIGVRRLHETPVMVRLLLPDGLSSHQFRATDPP